MNPALDKLLCETFPKLYGQRGLPVTDTCMCWGFECGDGWFLILWNLSKQIAEKFPNVQAVQVKEKYGTLRFYINGYPEGIDDLINPAEKLSATTCEECGQPGKSCDTRGWYRTLCADHA